MERPLKDVSSLKPVVDMSKVFSVIRSPFRYPGGKSWLAPVIEQWLRSDGRDVTTFVEAFAGGASVGLTIAASGLTKNVVLVESDPDVAAVWHCVFSSDADLLATRLVTFKMCSSSVAELLNSSPCTTVDRAFRTIVRNRVSHGGKMTATSGLMSKGDGQGLLSRWYPVVLAARIRDASRLSSVVTFVEGDAFDELPKTANNTGAVCFIDPPYASKSRLYAHSQIDHQRLFELASRRAGRTVLCYDNTVENLVLAAKHELDVQMVSTRAGAHKKATELLISSDLSWVAPATAAVIR